MRNCESKPCLQSKKNTTERGIQTDETSGRKYMGGKGKTTYLLGQKGKKKTIIVRIQSGRGGEGLVHKRTESSQKKEGDQGKMLRGRGKREGGAKEVLGHSGKSINTFKKLQGVGSVFDKVTEGR